MPDRQSFPGQSSYIPLHHRSALLVVAATVVFLSGLAYYLFFRIYAGATADIGDGSYPSLVHMLSLTWLAFALTGIRRGWLLSTLLLGMSIVGEYIIGYFYARDLMMLLCGYSLGAVSATHYLRHIQVKHFPSRSTLAGTSLIALGSVFILGSGPGCIFCPTEQVRNAKPVYLSYQELRGNSITVTDPRSLTDISRVYVYGNTIFLNNTNNGIHVLDNSDQTNPQNVGFIAIPGNTELSIRSNYLYVDSYVDLVTIDINDPRNVFEVDREIDIFPYDPYQNIPDDVYFGYDGINEQRGVVVGYEFIN